MRTHLNLSDLRGLSRLAAEAAAQITDVVEDMHSTISTPFSVLGPARPGRTGGITGLVYRSVRGGLWLAGAGVDAALAGAAALVGERPSTPEREAMLAVVNGIWGDHLAATRNPLAIEMSLRYGGRSLALDRESLCAAIPAAAGNAGGKVVVLVHGLCMNDLGWARGVEGYGERLARDLGYTPVYLHYNSGLHVSTNGRRFAELLDGLVEQWPQPVEELVIIGHSMGGLVARSACHYAGAAGYAWPRRLRKLIFAGTPHHGAPLERIGNFAGLLLEATAYTAPFRRLGTNRSAGITDLRYGNVLDEDWEGLDRFAHHPDNRHPVPLPAGVQCYAIAATLGAASGDLKDLLLGDGLVPLRSALGLCDADPDRCLPIPEAHQWVAHSTGHAELLDSDEVYGKIREWVG